jgi:hypothetical protein
MQLRDLRFLGYARHDMSYTLHVSLILGRAIAKRLM